MQMMESLLIGGWDLEEIRGHVPIFLKMNTIEIKVLANGVREGPRYESIPAIDIGYNRFRVLSSPGLANGFASGDILELKDSSGSFKVVERSGNICVQIFYCGEKEEALKEFGGRFEKIGGRLDGGFENTIVNLLIYTIPFTAGFRAIEGVFQSVPEAIQLDEWLYGNIYSDDGKPLNWWVEFPSTKYE